MKGYFITFEGIDGCGKSLMQQKSAAALAEKGYDVLCTREPGGSETGRRIRQILLDSPLGAVDERSETLLYAADRSLHVSQVILPAIEGGKIVLCDRYVDSSYAYQGSGRQVSLDTLREINRFASFGLLPDLTLLLDLPATTALARLRGKKDRLEQEATDFFDRVAAAYRSLAQEEPDRFVVIDASKPMKIVTQTVLEAILGRITER